MKKLLGIVVLSLFLITPSQADDIKDFEIEGISIGDSLLDYFSEKEIKDNSKSMKIYKSFGTTTFSTTTSVELKSKLKQYDHMQIEYMLDDKNYIIIGLSAAKIEDNFEMNNCIKESEKISNEVKKLFGESVKYQHDKIQKASADRSGKSIVDARFFIFKDGSYASIRCNDWSKEMKLKDRLSVDLVSIKFRKIADKAHPHHKK